MLKYRPTLGEINMPLSPAELPEGTVVDFVYVLGDAYVDHPSFGGAIISRILQAEGFTVGIISQPDWKNSYRDKDKNGVCLFGRPRLGFLVSGGNIDSMVAHYTAAKKKRSEDYYSPGGKAGYRPDRPVIVYCNRIREAYGDVPIIIGGLEASLRRFAHYDYWDNKVRRSILIDSTADILSYGMGEYAITRIARLLDKGVPIKKIRDVKGTVYVASLDDPQPADAVVTFDYNTLKTDKKAYAEAFRIQYENQDAVGGKTVIELYDNKKLIQNPPAPILTREELDRVYSLPYTRKWHPSYEKDGGVPALTEVEFSITHNRGCFGGCSFCALAFHQGRNIVSRSIESVVAEAELLTALPGFKGYIHDIGGPTANFRYSPCKAVKEGKKGICPNRRCLAPKPCGNLVADHSEYVELLRQVSSLPRVKKVFIRSGVRFDYVMADRDDTFFRELVTKHVSGQLKVAPEHISPKVLSLMGKPEVETYNKFCDKYFTLCEKAGLEQYLVPYLMSSHPGSTLNEAVDLALYLKKKNIRPEQVQDFYPTPGTASTTMYYTGIDPFSGKAVYIPDSYEEKRLQRALLQSDRRENYPLVKKALEQSGRQDASFLLPGGAASIHQMPSKSATKSTARGEKVASATGKATSDAARTDRKSEKPARKTPGSILRKMKKSKSKKK